MAALNFPDAPDTQTPTNTFSPTSTPLASTNGVTYVYNSGVWTAQATPQAGNIIVPEAETAPEGAIVGNLWYNTTSKRLFIYVTGENGPEWVDASPIA